MMNSYIIENYITEKRAKELLDLLPLELKNGKDMLDGKVVKEGDDFLGCIVERDQIDDIVTPIEEKHPVKYYGSIILKMLEHSPPHVHTGKITLLLPLEGKMKFNISNHISDKICTELSKYPVEFVADYNALNAIIFDGRKVHWSGEGGENIRTHLVVDFI